MQTKPQDTPIRQRIASLIGQSGRTQRDVADAAGVSPQRLSAIMTGDRADLRADTVTRLARALGLSAAALGKLLYECVPQGAEK